MMMNPISKNRIWKKVLTYMMLTTSRMLHYSSKSSLYEHIIFLVATIDVKKNIYDLSCNKFDTQIAVVENQGMFDSVQESSVRLYDVGRRRDDEDEGVSWIYVLVYNTIQRKYCIISLIHYCCCIISV